jgi:hypothetical protein
MAKFKLTPEAVTAALPFVIAGMKWLAARTDSNVDDKAAEAVEKALSNPIIMAFLLSLLVEDVAPQATSVSAEEESDIAAISSQADVIKLLFGVAVP